MQVVRRSGHMADVVSIDYKTADISATAGKDYEATEGTLTFQVGRRTMQSTTCTRTVHVHLHVACTCAPRDVSRDASRDVTLEYLTLECDAPCCPRHPVTHRAARPSWRAPLYRTP